MEVVKAHTDILKYIKAGWFTHILVLLKLLFSKQFYYIFILPFFRSHVSFVVINKYYLVIN